MVVHSILSKDRETNDGVTLITSRKDLGSARKLHAIKATARCKALFGLIKDKAWDEFLYKLAYHENDAREWIEEHNDDGTTRWKSLFIHLVCEHRPPVNVVSELIRIYPGGLGEKNYGGDLPIHVACREGANEEVIDMILNSDEYESAKVADCEGRLPLHLAVCNKNVSVKTIQNLIKVNDRATRTKDDFDLLPLHWACSKNASPRVVESIIQAYPYAIEAKDSYGRTPLDLTKKSKNPEKAHILELLSRDVSSWTSAMMSTVVTLSNKVLETERMEADYKIQKRVIEEYKGISEEKEREVETLKLEMELLEQRFAEEIDYLKNMHKKQLERQKAESDEKIVEITKEKEEAVKRVADLKLLVDEVVSQLKDHQSIVDEKEGERKKLKEKAFELVRKIDNQKAETRATQEENMRLKEQQMDLRDEINRKNEHLRSLKSSFQHPLRMLDELKSDRGHYGGNTFEGGLDRYYDEDEYRQGDKGGRNQFQCTKLDDGSSFSNP